MFNWAGSVFRKVYGPVEVMGAEKITIHEASTRVKKAKKTRDMMHHFETDNADEMILGIRNS